MSSVKPTFKERVSKFLVSLHEALSTVWSYGLGKIGLILLFAVIVISIYALITMPPGFIAKWNSPQTWWNYPKEAPPEWTRLLGAQLAKHEIVVLKGSELSIERVGRRQYVVFETTYSLDVDGFPQRINTSITLSRVIANKEISAKLVVVRPDDVVLTIGESPINLSRTTAQFISSDPEKTAYSYIAVIKKYKISQTIYSRELDNIKLMYTQAVFGVPKVVKVGEREKIVFEPLKGEYKIRILIPVTKDLLREIQRDGVKEVVITIVGQCYGWLGTDIQGRDLALGILYGFPVALLVGFFAATTATMIGMIAGVISGYYGGIVDESIQRLVDIMINVPLLPILVLIGAIAQIYIPNPWLRLFIIIGFLILFSWGGTAIIVRSMTLSIKSEPYIEAAKAVGASDVRIIFKHIIPQVIPYVFAVLVFSVPGAILTEAGLSILGIRHGLPTWGQILSDARRAVPESMGMWWWILPPGIMLALTSFTFVSLGMALETIVEPRLRRT